MADLGAMLDKMQIYNRALELHGYVRNGDGKKPWSTRWTLGTFHIDIRNSDWTVYIGELEVASSQDPELLIMYLNGDHENGGYL
jgi:hypothetical protein